MMGMGNCRMGREGTSTRPASLVCRIDGREANLEIISGRGLMVRGAARNRDDRIFWEYPAYAFSIDVNDVVSSVAEFLRLYLSAVEAAVKDAAAQELYQHPLTAELVAKQYDAGRNGLVRTLRQLLHDFDAKNALTRGYSAETKADDKAVLESLIGALDTQFESMEKWAKRVSEAYDSVEVDTTRFSFASEGGKISYDDVYNEYLQSFARKAPEAGRTELDEESAKLLKDGSDKGGEALAKYMGKLLDGGAADPYDEVHLRNAISDGSMARAFSSTLYDGIASSDTLAGSINNALTFAEETEETLKAKAEEIGDWAKGLIGLSKKKKAVSSAVPEGSLKPGEAQVIEAVHSAKAASHTEAVARKAEKLKLKHKFRLKPKFNAKNILSGDVLSVLERVDVGYALTLSKGKTEATLDFNVRVDNPLNAAQAKAVIEVKLDAKHTTNNGVITAGLGARANVVGIYKTPTVEDVIVSGYVRYKSNDGRVSAGFFTTLTVPLTDAGNQRTVFKEGAEAHIRADLTWHSEDGRDKFTAYVDGRASQMGSTDFRAGARWNRQVTESMSFFVDVSAGHSTGRGFGGGEAEGRAMVGFSFRF
jgi:hypothetical protein